MDKKELTEYREEISRIDVEMAELFARRMEAAKGVAAYKMEHGLPVEDLAQEKRVIESRSALIEDEDLRSYYVQFLQYTMDVSKNWQRRQMDGRRIAYCSIKPVNAAAAAAVFPDGVLVSYADYADAYNSVERGDCDVAILPFEGSRNGEIGEVLDLIYNGSLYINSMYEHVGENSTIRYAVLSRVESKSLESDVSGVFLLMFTVNDEAGSLAKAINIISAYDFNMRIMRSRPMKDLPWHYYFYAEAEGDDTSDNGQRMLRALRVACPMVKIVGRYPATSI